MPHCTRLVAAAAVLSRVEIGAGDDVEAVVREGGRVAHAVGAHLADRRAARLLRRRVLLARRVLQDGALLAAVEADVELRALLLRRPLRELLLVVRERLGADVARQVQVLPVRPALSVLAARLSGRTRA